MYSREVDGDARTFGVSGKLWHGVLVMYDRESESLWTQLDGRAIQGDALGATLAHVPSVYTTWSEWRRAHPDTLVLDMDEEERAREGSRYAEYFADPDRLYFDRLDEGLGGVSPKDVVFGVAVGGEALAVTEDLLASTGVANAVVGGVPVGFAYDARKGWAVAVDRRLDDGRVVVMESRAGEGELFADALTGEVRGLDELAPLRVDRAYWYAWARSHPGSRVLAD